MGYCVNMCLSLRRDVSEIIHFFIFHDKNDVDAITDRIKRFLSLITRESNENSGKRGSLSVIHQANAINFISKCYTMNRCETIDGTP